MKTLILAAIRWSLVFTAAVGFSLACPAKANLMANGGFETGDFTGWTPVDASVDGTVSGLSPHSGAFQASFGCCQTSVTQSVTTTPGASFVVDFWLAGLDFDFFLGPFDVVWGGAIVFEVNFLSNFGYTEFTFPVTASSATTELQFSSDSLGDFGYLLDDVSVTPTGVGIPDSGLTAMLLSTALTCLGLIRRFVRVHTSRTQVIHKATESTTRSLKFFQPATALAIVIACLILVCPAQAGYIVTLHRVGPDIVATGSGAIDLTGLTKIGTGSVIIPPGEIRPEIASLGMVPDTSFSPVDSYSGIVGPGNFGGGGGTIANSGRGDCVVIIGRRAINELLVPMNYISNIALSNSATYNNATFASLGVTPGTYVWSWGTGANQNVTLQIGVPDSGSTLGLFLLSFAALFGVSRFRSLRLA